MNEIGELKERFAKLKKPERQAPPPRPRRKQARVYLRVGDDLACDLQLIKLAGGVDINAFGEQALRDAVRTRLELLRRGFDDHAWHSLVKLAREKARTGAR
jgi:hypothetical protein